MLTQSLNGIWNYKIGKGGERKIKVPFSALAVGHSECSRSFHVAAEYEKIYLKFDGITYSAKVFVNEAEIGKMLPYCEYSFDITDCVKRRGNSLRVELEDISPAFGPTEGWENFGGIIRDVSLVYLPENHIENVFAHSVLTENYKSAELTVETECTNTNNSEFEISLSYGGKSVLEYTQSALEAPVKVTINDIHPWSPENPELYVLTVRLKTCGTVTDTYICKYGFRELSHDRHRFFLNGRPLFLVGVCKHEMVADSGHCPTERQMRDDLLMIKETGCNFVRLVHYPHNKKILDFADEIGLFVSEEPGLWWSDTSDTEIAKASLEVLKRTILRDRNHPCIAFWLCFNECRFTENFLIDSASVCRKYDPTRMVSGANCMSNEDTKKYYSICNFDFYTMHPYSATFERARQSAEFLNDKPLIFTEWGGYYVYNNPSLLADFIEEMNRLYTEASDDGALAGAFFWCWAEVNDFNRGAPACTDGRLKEGLVTYDRKPLLNFDAFCKSVSEIGKKKEETPFWHTAEIEMDFGKNYLKNGDFHRLEEKMKQISTEMSPSSVMRPRKLTKGPVLKEVLSLNDIPVMICDGDELQIEYNRFTENVTIVGLVSMSKGYPLSGEYGEDVFTLEISYDSGETEKHAFKNGVDVTTAFTVHKSSRINPVAESAKRTLTFGYDKNFECYVINSVTLKTENRSKIKQLSFHSSDNGYDLLLYGVF